NISAVRSAGSAIPLKKAKKLGGDSHGVLCELRCIGSRGSRVLRSLRQVSRGGSTAGSSCINRRGRSTGCYRSVERDKFERGSSFDIRARLYHGDYFSCARAVQT